MPANNTIFNQSVFAQYFLPDDAGAIAWSDNVLAKMIDGGIAKFILREDKDGNATDINDLFEPITIFFSYFVTLARQFENITTNSYLLNEYLLQKGFYDSGAESLNQLLYAVENYLRIAAQRGTTKMIQPSTDVNIPDGELLRLVGWSNQVFFKLGVGRPEFNCWNADNSSPTFRGLTGRYDLNIGYEFTEHVEDLSAYPLINSNNIFHTWYHDKKCLEIEGVAPLDSSGIGANDSSKRIIVDPRFDFEITFYVAQDITIENITFGCLAFDSGGNPISLTSVLDGSDTNFFFETRRLNKAGKFYLVRGILFNKDKGNVTADEAILNIGFGRNLRMTESVVSIIPYIVMDNDNSDDSEVGLDNFASNDISYATQGSDSSDPDYDGQPSIYLWNIKVTPCSLEYGRCYLNNKNFIDLIVQNNNGKYSHVEIYNILRKYFIPYNTAFQVTNLDDLGSVQPETNLLLLEDSNYILLEDSNRIELE